jgi:transcriptional regulator with XRE-family HTH domain
MIEERIKQIMSTYGLTAGQFAETLGTQASGISHILSGRNKPSLDFITKVLIKFPEIDYNWLVLGKGSMKQLPFKKQEIGEISLFETENLPQTEQLNTKKEPEKELIEPTIEQVQVKEPINEEPIEVPCENKEKEPEQQKRREINRIIVFYNDNTYEEVAK